MNNTVTNTARLLGAGLRALLVLTLVTGVLYPLAVTGVAQAAFSDQANGSRITQDGKTVGSSLIGQNFTLPKKNPDDADEVAQPDPKWFQPRPGGYDPFVTGAWNSEVYVPNVAELLEGLIANAEQQLATLRTSAAALGVTAETSVMTGRPAHAIVEHAKEGGFDLIVMGTHGRTGLSHVVMGSVAERIVRKAPCPVLTVHASEAAGAGKASAAA